MNEPEGLNMLHRSSDQNVSAHIIDFDDDQLARLAANLDEADNDVRASSPAAEDTISSRLNNVDENQSMPRSDSVGTLCIKNKAFSRESFYAQAILIYIISLACIINLSTGTEHSHVWVSLLSASLGFILPAPKVRGPRKNTIVGISREVLPSER